MNAEHSWYPRSRAISEIGHQGHRRAGDIGQTAVLVNDADLVLPNVNWQQGFNDGRTGLIVGRFDPNDYINVLGVSNPWTAFQNLAIVLDASILFPDTSHGWISRARSMPPGCSMRVQRP